MKIPISRKAVFILWQGPGGLVPPLNSLNYIYVYTSDLAIFNTLVYRERRLGAIYNTSSYNKAYFRQINEINIPEQLNLPITNIKRLFI